MIDDHSTVMLNSAKMEELGLFNGDTVLLKGKKRKNTVAVVTADNLVSESRVRMSKVIRSNLRLTNSLCDNLLSLLNCDISTIDVSRVSQYDLFFS